LGAGLWAVAKDDPFVGKLGLDENPDIVLERVLAGEEFSAGGLLHRIKEIYLELLLSLIKAISEMFPDFDLAWPIEGSGKFQGDLFSVSLLIIGAVTIVLLIIWTIARTGAIKRTRKSGTRSIEDEDIPLGRLTAEQLWEHACRTAEKGRHTKAVIFFFRAFLMGLDEKGIIRLRPGLTNREILAVIEHSSPQREKLERMVPIFNSIRYGSGVSDEGTVDLFKDLSATDSVGPK
jgi:hypothetical protein